MSLKKLKHYLLITLGVFLISLSVNAFLAPFNIAAGGASGLGILLDARFSISPFITVLVINVLVLTLAFLFLGIDVFLKSLLGSVLLPVMLAIIPEHALLSNQLLSVVIGSIIFGLGVTLLYNNNASSGGTTIPPLILEKYKNIDKSVGLFVIDLIIVLLSFFIFGFESFVLAILSIIITSFTMNFATTGFDQRLLMYVMSGIGNKKISQAIYENISRNVVSIPSTSGFGEYGREVLMVTFRRRDYQKVKRVIDTIDPSAFVIVQTIKDVHGHEFTYNGLG